MSSQFEITREADVFASDEASRKFSLEAAREKSRAATCLASTAQQAKQTELLAEIVPAILINLFHFSFSRCIQKTGFYW